ncbi:MAG: GHKL domain-containing protein, partial [Kordiimonadaceae bacterium]|nr:GHKL domain-containing protein [Kordiimonadaceae bacterium]
RRQRQMCIRDSSLNIMVLGIAVELRSDARFELQIFLALLSLMGLLLGGLVTARARAKKQLANQFKTIAHLDRMNTMGELATHIIHELAQPINTTSLYASGAIRMLEAGKLDQEELLNVLSLTAVETTRMQELIRRMKAFAKNGELVREETTAQAIIEGVGHMIDMAAKQAHVSVSYCLPKEKLPLTVDNIQIQQAVLNLVRNSIEAMETGERKELTIRASRIDDRNICISITDTGPGMPNDLVLGTTTKPGGMGVGLRIVDAIVNAHFGTLHINQNTISLILKI